MLQGARMAIFDLDDCIIPTAPFRQDVIKHLTKAIKNQRLKKIVTAFMQKTTSLEKLAVRTHIPGPIMRRMHERYRDFALTEPVVTFGDDMMIALLPVEYKMLVTTGFRKFQQSKIDRLAIKNAFTEIVIDALDDPGLRIGKKQLFANIQFLYNLKPQEIAVIGDNPSSELKAGRELGMITVQTLRPGVRRWRKADHHVYDFHELRFLMS